jgi:hypothetical protein
MSSSSDRIGVATIDVNTMETVTATHRVKTASGFVLWIVHNLTQTNVTVCVTDFTPVDGAGLLRDEDMETFLDEGWCTRVLAPGDTGPILGRFTGKPESVYHYNVKVNNVIATDPQLEI